MVPGLWLRVTGRRCALGPWGAIAHARSRRSMMVPGRTRAGAMSGGAMRECQGKAIAYPSGSYQTPDRSVLRRALLRSVADVVGSGGFVDVETGDRL